MKGRTLWNASFKLTLFGCVISICCVGFASLDVVCDVLNDCALWYVVLVCHQYDVCENSVGSVYVGGYGGLSESGLCVLYKLCAVCFLVIGKGPSVLL